MASASRTSGKNGCRRAAASSRVWKPPAVEIFAATGANQFDGGPAGSSQASNSTGRTAVAATGNDQGSSYTPLPARGLSAMGGPAAGVAGRASPIMARRQSRARGREGVPAGETFYATPAPPARQAPQGALNKVAAPPGAPAH